MTMYVILIHKNQNKLLLEFSIYPILFCILWKLTVSCQRETPSERLTAVYLSADSYFKSCFPTVRMQPPWSSGTLFQSSFRRWLEINLDDRFKKDTTAHTLELGKVKSDKVIIRDIGHSSCKEGLNRQTSSGWNGGTRGEIRYNHRYIKSWMTYQVSRQRLFSSSETRHRKRR